MDDNNHFNASWERCGTCHFWSGERRIEFINGTARWIYCRKNETLSWTSSPMTILLLPTRVL